MIEVYVHTNEKLSLRVYNAGVRSTATNVLITVTDTSDGTVLATLEPAVTETEDIGGTTYEFYTYILPLSIMNTCRILRVDWQYDISGETVVQPEYVEVVVPYVTPDELIQHFPEFRADGPNPKTFDELKEVERAVRHTIDTYCKQSFGKELATSKTVLGKSSDVLMLPNRLYSLDTVTFEDVDITTSVHKDFDKHWTLRIDLDYDSALKRDIQELFTTRFFKEGRRYVVTGDWGWEYVPNEVNLAARLLVANKYCKDEAYRQKYIESARSADFRVEYWKPGNLTTGLVDADMMLSRYRLLKMVVV